MKFKISLVIFIAIFLVIFNISINNPKSYIDEIKFGYKGVLIKKYFLKIDHFVFKIDHSELDIVIVADELRNNIEIGDSIIKIPNDNYCIIIKPDKSRLKVSYIYIPNNIRNDFRWPVEWKNKWIK